MEEGKGSHLVSWEVVGKPVNQRGLEIGNSRLHNKAPLAKWLWWFTLDPESLWQKITMNKHSLHPYEWMEKGVKGTPKPVEGYFFSSLLILFPSCFLYCGR